MKSNEVIVSCERTMVLVYAVVYISFTISIVYVSLSSSLTECILQK